MTRPDTEETIGISVVERKVTWDNPRAIAQAFTEVVTTTTWGEPHGQSHDQDEWGSVDLERAASAFGGASTTVELKGDRYRASLFNHPAQSTIRFDLTGPFSDDDRSELRRVLVALAKVLPDPRFASARIGPDPFDFHDQRDLPFLSDAFEQSLAWAHALSPNQVADLDLDLALLRDAPVHDVSVDDDGWVCVQVFDDPLTHTDADVLDVIEAATRYLLEMGA